MAGLFGRRSRFQRGGRSSGRTRTKWKKKVVWKQQKLKNPINYNKRFSHSKAGTGKAIQGSESGSSQESSSSSTSNIPKPEPSSIPNPPFFFFFKTCRRRGRTPGSRRQSRTSQYFYSPNKPTSSTTFSAILFKVRYGPSTNNSTGTAAAAAAAQKTFLFFSFFIFFNPKPRIRTCEIAGKNGRKFSSPSAATATAAAVPAIIVFFKIRPKAQWYWWWGDRGSSRRSHCKVYWPQRPPQQGLHSQRPKGPPSAALCSHCHSVLRCPRPPWLRPPQQSCRLAH